MNKNIQGNLQIRIGVPLIALVQDYSLIVFQSFTIHNLLLCRANAVCRAVEKWRKMRS